MPSDVIRGAGCDEGESQSELGLQQSIVRSLLTPRVCASGAATLLVVVVGLKVFPELAGLKSVEGISKSSPPPE